MSTSSQADVAAPLSRRPRAENVQSRLEARRRARKRSCAFQSVDGAPPERLGAPAVGIHSSVAVAGDERVKEEGVAGVALRAPRSATTTTRCAWSTRSSTCRAATFRRSGTAMQSAARSAQGARASSQPSARCAAGSRGRRTRSRRRRASCTARRGSPSAAGRARSTRAQGRGVDAGRRRRACACERGLPWAGVAPGDAGRCPGRRSSCAAPPRLRRRRAGGERESPSAFTAALGRGADGVARARARTRRLSRRVRRHARLWRGASFPRSRRAPSARVRRGRRCGRRSGRAARSAGCGCARC